MHYGSRYTANPIRFHHVKIANLGQGLREVVIEHILDVTSEPAHAANINIETSLNPPSNVPPVNQLTTLDYQGRLPISESVYVQPGLSEGMDDVSDLTIGEDSIMKTLSSNNALKRGNVSAAESILGRPTTVEEIENKTTTPNIRSNESGTKNKHISLERGQLKGNVENPSSSLRQRETQIHLLGREIDELAQKHTLSPESIIELKARYNIINPATRTGESKQPSIEDYQAAIDAIRREGVYKRNQQYNQWSGHPDAGTAILAALNDKGSTIGGGSVNIKK